MPLLLREGSDAGQQLIEHDAQGVDIARRGDGASLLLLRARVAPGHPSHLLGLGLLRGRGLSGRRLVGHQFGNAEIEELHHSAGGDQDIGGLEIAMHHQITVGKPDGATHRQIQLETLRN